MVASREQVPVTNNGGLSHHTVDERHERNLNHNMTQGTNRSTVSMNQYKTSLENPESGYRPPVSHSVTNFLSSQGLSTVKIEKSTPVTSTGSSSNGQISPIQLTKDNMRPVSNTFSWPSSISFSPERDVYTSPSISPLDSASTSPTLLSPMSFCSNMTMSSPPEPLPFLSQTLSPRMPYVSAMPSILPPPTLFPSPLSSPGESTPISITSVLNGSPYLPNMTMVKPEHTAKEALSKSTTSIKEATHASENGSNGETKKTDEEKENRKRNKRSNFTSEQILKMQTLFEAEPYPDHEAMENLANELKLSEKQIKIWFQNKRARNRRRGGSVQKISPLNSNVSMPRIYSPMTPLGFAKPMDFSARSMPMGPMGFLPLDMPLPAVRNDPHPMLGNTTVTRQEPSSQVKHHHGSPNSSPNATPSWNPFWPVMPQYGSSYFNPSIYNENGRSPKNVYRAAEAGHWNGNMFF